jgi:hypothetical protein
MPFPGAQVILAAGSGLVAAVGIDRMILQKSLERVAQFKN